MTRARLGLGLLGLTAAALAAGCQDVGGTVALGVRDEAVYAREVHAVLEARCGTLDCHGDARRPLRIYAETGLRLRDELRGQPLTAEELGDNLRAIEAIDPGAAAEDHLLVRKPLAVAAGGQRHLGGELWATRTAAAPTCLVAFLGGRDDAAMADACAAARAEVSLPPP
ncbi:MAG: hypothetical protein IT370_03080 [Deltaproteobacteria bacterium]|nr:hypothetical protein [Deltaproteobacteria bacterium]